MAAPNSFRDPYWSDLAEKAANKVGVPPDLLVSILTNGERSNANQKSEAGAQTVFQIIPETRDRILKRDGIDAYLSDENAAEAAALTLKDGVRWAQARTQDPAAVNRYAAGYYHAGGDTKNWGPRTAAYVARVSKGLGQQPSQAPAETAGQDAPAQSTFDRVMAQMRPAESSIKTALQAYQSGKMSPQDAAAFETEVNAGRVMLPPGATLQPAQSASPAAAAPGQLPPAVADAYNSGRMSPEDAAQIDALVKSGAIAKPQRPQDLIPGQIIRPPEPAADPSLVDRVIGAGEAGLSTITGLTGGALGMAGGTIKGLAGAVMDGTYGTRQGVQDVERAAAQGAEMLTYQPRTQQGQAQTQAIGGALSQAVPAMPLTGELQLLARAGATAAPAVGATVRAGAQQAKQAGMAARQAASVLPRRAMERLSLIGRGDSAPTAGTKGSVGAAGVDMATQRRAVADQLPLPMGDMLTEGMLTRSPDQLKFEIETSKIPDVGKPLRDARVAINERLLDNFDMMVDMPDAEARMPQATGLREVGSIVDKAVTDKYNRARAEVNVKYRVAENSPEALKVVNPSTVVSVGSGDSAITSSPIDFLNSKPTGLKTTALPDHAKQYAVKLGIASFDKKGQLVGNPAATVKQMEAWRKEINQATGYESIDIANATVLKSMIDQITEPVSGSLYRIARSSRRRLAQEFEDVGVISKLLNEKRGTSDRQVALEDVFEHSIMKGSLDDVRTVRKVLQTAGENGKQAWRELQAAALRDIIEKSTPSATLDGAGNKILSADKLNKAINALDEDGKLDFIFSKKGAQTLRDARELAQIAKTVPPEAAVNFSNTASTLMSSVADVSAMAMTGTFVPVVTFARIAAKHVKDKKLRDRVAASLGKPATP